MPISNYIHILFYLMMSYLLLAPMTHKADTLKEETSDIKTVTDHATECVKVNQVKTTWGEPAQEFENTCNSKIQIFFCHVGYDKQKLKCGRTEGDYFTSSMYLDAPDDEKKTYYKWSNHISMPAGVLLEYKACFYDSKADKSGEGELNCGIPRFVPTPKEYSVDCGDKKVIFTLKSPRRGVISYSSSNGNGKIISAKGGKGQTIAYEEILGHICYGGKGVKGYKLLNKAKELIYPSLRKMAEEAWQECVSKYNEKACRAYKGSGSSGIRG